MALFNDVDFIELCRGVGIALAWPTLTNDTRVVSRIGFDKHLADVQKRVWLMPRDLQQKIDAKGLKGFIVLLQLFRPNQCRRRCDQPAIAATNEQSP